MPDYPSLQSRVDGPVLTPSDPGFAEELSGFNLFYTHTPEVVVGVTSTSDIVEAVSFAAANSLRISVQATGHGSHHTIESGMVIETKRLDSVVIDADARTATIGAGARWGAVVAAAAAFGLAPITGSSTNVGVVGYILGGGLGPLARSHGFSSDYLQSITIVTPDGTVVEASAESHPDLFWALRGGKGGFGVVTEVRIALVEMPALYAGSLTFAAPHIEQVLRAWVDYTATADERVTTSAAIFHFPPVEELPPHLRGQTLLSLRFAFPGDAATGEQLAAPLRAAAPAIVDALGVLPLTDVATIHADPSDPGPGWNSGRLLNAIDQDFVTALLAGVGAGVETPLMIAEVRHIGGASHRDVPGGSAVGGRASEFALSLIGAPNPALFAEVLPAVSEGLLASLAPWVSTETTINFANGGDPLTEFTRAWPAATYERLESIRHAVDPRSLMAYGPERS